MIENTDKTNRKHIRLKDYDYSTPGAYFITICAESRKNLFWDGNIDINKFHWNAVGATVFARKICPCPI